MASDSQNLKILGKNLKAQRKLRGLTQESVAALCGFDPTYISLMERGKRNPAFLSLVMLAEAMNCKVSDLTAGI
jgi:transcriptional regulator with XRE-family HTH domain